MLTPHGWLEVREADDERDTRCVAAVLRRCYPQEAWTTQDVRRFADRAGNGVKVLALGDDGYPAGALLYREAEDAVVIARVAVDRQFRRCRAAAYALRSLTGPTSPLRRGVYEARVHETNEAGIALMKRCGFAPAYVARGHFWDGMDAYVFRLHRSAPDRVRSSLAVA